MIIKVEQKHIDKGERDNCDKCPIALAMKDAGFHKPMVRLTSLHWFENEKAKKVISPDCCIFFVGRFDIGDHVEPFEFQISSF